VENPDYLDVITEGSIVDDIFPYREIPQCGSNLLASGAQIREVGKGFTFLLEGIQQSSRSPWTLPGDIVNNLVKIETGLGSEFITAHECWPSSAWIF